MIHILNEFILFFFVFLAVLSIGKETTLKVMNLKFLHLEIDLLWVVFNFIVSNNRSNNSSLLADFAVLSIVSYLFSLLRMLLVILPSFRTAVGGLVDLRLDCRLILSETISSVSYKSESYLLLSIKLWLLIAFEGLKLSLTKSCRSFLSKDDHYVKSSLDATVFSFIKCLD